MAASVQLEQRVEALEAMASASECRQDMLAGNLIDVRDTVKRIESKVDRLTVSQRDTEAWQNITDQRLASMGEDIFELKGNFAKLNLKYDGLSKKVGDLNTKYERLDQKVGLLAEDVGGLKAGQIELRDMVATLLARSESVEKRK